MITSASNVQIKKVQQILKKAKVRREEQVFAVEGIKMFSEVPKSRLQKVYLSQSFARKEECEKILLEKGISIEETEYVELVDDKIFKNLSDTVTPQGVLCLVKMENYSLSEILSREENPLLMILEDLQDPGHLGTILRTGEGAGVTGVIMSRTSVDVFNPKVIRSTMGSVYRMPIIYVNSIEEEVLPLLKEKGITTYAAHLKGRNDYDEECYTKGAAFLIGNEGNGLTEQLTESADTLIKIPMQGKVESLNAAMASGILMYEAYRQRRKN